MRFGKTLVVEEADSIEPFMHPLLAGDMQGQGSGSPVKIGDRLVDHNKEFRLMLVSRSPQPRLAGCAAALLTIVNFSITRSGSPQPCILHPVMYHLSALACTITLRPNHTY